MTTETAVEDQVVETPEDDNNDDFNSGFESTSQTTTPANDAGATVAPVAETSEPAAEVAPATKYAQITEEQFATLMAQAGQIEQIKSDSKRQIDTLSGHLGGMKQLVDRLQSNSKSLTPGQLKRVQAEFPELGKLLEEDLRESLGSPVQMDPEEIDRRAQAIVAAELPKLAVQMETKLLRSYHKDWKEVVTGDEFKAWELTLPPDEQAKLKNSTDGEYIADQITAFKAAKKLKPAPPPPTSTRSKRLEAAVAPRGSGGTAPGPTDEDEFNAGFNSP